MADRKAANYLAEMGEAVIAQGYNIIPIKRGEKYPPHDNWQKTKATPTWLAKALKDGIKQTNKDGEERTIRVSDAGIGILTKNTPGVDIDVSDKEMSKYLEDWVQERMGQMAAPVRIGRAPRRLLMFRCDEPFSKVNSNEYLDEWGEKHKVEVLADGQQFVAYHIHPDTKKPYDWIYKSSPVTMHANDLPTITRDQAQEIVDEFERQAKKRGWKLKTRSRTAPQRNALAVVDDDDTFDDVAAKPHFEEGQLHALLMDVPNCDEYQQWIEIGMALYHQFDGDEEGFELWDEWSQAASNYEPDALRTHWDSFNIESKGRLPLTAKIIQKRATEWRKEQAVEIIAALKQQFEDADSKTLFDAACKSVKQQEMDQLDRESFAVLAKTTYKRIAGDTLNVQTARKLVRYENPNIGSVPKWLEGYVYLSTEDKFYHIPSASLPKTHSAFNSMFNQHLLTKQDIMEGKARPEKLADDYAMNVVKIPVCEGRLYLPTAEQIFTMEDREGIQYANRYTDKSVPFMPEAYTVRDKRNIKVVEGHFEHLIADKRERELFKDWLAYLVQTKQRPNWAIFLQGAESDGKSFFSKLMAKVLGHENVNLVDPKSMESDFNAWAEGAQLNVVEEVKMHGHNKFDVLNRVKPLITNPTIAITRKGQDPFNAPNTAAYLLLSNYRDAMPVGIGSTRFLILLSRYQDPRKVDQFNTENPDYYNKLFDAVDESPGALRKWLMDRVLSPEFNPKKRAPKSKSREYVVQLNESPELSALNEILAESMRMDVSDKLLNLTALEDVFQGHDAELPYGRALAKMLNDDGWTRLGRIKVDGAKVVYWSKDPELFLDNKGDLDTDKVRAFADPGL
jgi:hypothetical protein